MTLVKRIIPCLDIKDGRTVKGIQFESIKDAGDPIELARLYAETGADELVFLDITATHENRQTVIKLVSRVAREINIPFTVGGGIDSVELVYKLLRAGADKVAVNSAAINRPNLLNELAQQFGNQCIVLAIDAKQIESKWTVHTHGGRRATELDLFQWAKEGQERGAGEILFTSMDNDGTKKGFAISALSQLKEVLHIPIIASGGAGSMSDFKEVFDLGKSDAALAASLFHYKDISIPQLKQYLSDQGLPIRL